MSHDIYIHIFLALSNACRVFVTFGFKMCKKIGIRMAVQQQFSAFLLTARCLKFALSPHPSHHCVTLIDITHNAEHCRTVTKAQKISAEVAKCSETVHFRFK